MTYSVYDSASDDFNLFNNSGRVLLKKRFKLWEGDGLGPNTRVASFNTSILVNIYRPDNKTAAEGLAFVISPDLHIPANSSGQYLGLTNASIDGNATNQVVAVELDTFKQSFDPDDNHVGIDINSVRSVIAEPLARHGITLVPMGVKFFNLWVDYDGGNRIMLVYIAEQAEKLGPTPPKPGSPILSYPLNLTEHVNQYSYFGFSASTGNFTQLNCVLRWNLTVDHFTDDDRDWHINMLKLPNN